MDWFLYDNGLRHEGVKDYFSRMYECDGEVEIRHISSNALTILIAKLNSFMTAAVIISKPVH